MIRLNTLGRRGWQSVGFNPLTDLSNLVIALDAPSLALSADDPVTAFTDLSGNDRHLAPTGSPTFETDIFSSGAVRIPSGTYFSSDAFSWAATAAAPKAFYIVCSSGAVGFAQTLLSGLNNGNPDTEGRLRVRVDLGSFPVTFDINSFVTPTTLSLDNTATGLAQDTPGIINGTLQGATNSSIRVNNDTNTTGSLTDLPDMGGVRIGADDAGGNPFVGDYAALYICDVPSATAHGAMIAYLADRHGVTL